MADYRMLGNGCPYASTRALEVGLSFMMFSCGVALWWQGNTFALPSYAIVRHYINEETGGTVFIICGIIRLLALWVNGKRRPTPIIRLVGCAIGSGFWLTMVIAMGTAVSKLDLPGIPLLLPISLTLMGCEFYSALRCGADASYLGTWRRVRVRNNGH